VTPAGEAGPTTVTSRPAERLLRELSSGALTEHDRQRARVLVSLVVRPDRGTPAGDRPARAF
jgi:hypothetical protein